VAKITIIGLGLIGTSLGLALKKSNLPEVILVGHEIEREAAIHASKRGAVDKVEPYLPAAVEDAAMVIIATPVLAIREVLQEIAPHLAEGAIVTDTGSTKRMVLQWAAEFLPPSVSFVGGHPMAGKTESGPDAAEADLFQGVPYCIVGGKDARPEAVEAVVDLVRAIGAVPYFVDAAEHDTYVAAVSHLPIAISAALVTVTARSPSWRELSKLAAGGFRDVSRLAQGDPIMSRDILLTNREAVAHWVDELIKELYSLRNMLIDNPPDLEQRVQDLFYHAWQSRADWVTGEAYKEQDSTPETPQAGPTISRLLMGEWVTRKFEQEQQRDPRRLGQQPSKLKQKGKGWFRR